jgi:hypothetical protein
MHETPAMEQNNSSLESGENGSFEKLSQHTLFVEAGKTYSDTMTLNIQLSYDLKAHDDRIAMAQIFFDQMRHFRTQNKEHRAYSKLLHEMEEVFSKPFNDTVDRYHRILNMLSFHPTDIQTSTENRFKREICYDDFCDKPSNLAKIFQQHAIDSFHIDTNFQFHYGTESHDIILSRHKRFIPLIIGLVAATFIGVSFVMSTYSVVEIHNLYKGLQSLQDSHNNLVIEMQNFMNETQNLGDMVKDIYNFQQLALEKNPAVTGVKFGVKLKAVEDDVVFLEHLFADLQKGRLYEGFFRQNSGNLTLTSVMKSAVKKAAETGYRPIVSQEMEYLALDVSHLIVDRKIVIIVHVPCVREASSMTIYKPLPFPYPLSLNFDKEHFGSNNESGLYIEAEDQLIAVSMDNSRFKLLKESYLQRCFHRNSLYVCENNNRVLKNFKSHCISALYIGNVKAIHDQCSFRRRSLFEHVVQIGKQNFLIFSPISTDAVVSCANAHSTFTVTIESYRLTNLTLLPGCFISLPESDQYSSDNVKLTFYTIRSFHSADLLDFPSNLMEDGNRFDKMLANFTRKHDKFVQAMEKLKTKVASTLNDFDMSPSFGSLFPNIPSSIIAAIVSAIVIIAIILCLKHSKDSRKYQPIEEKKSESKIFVNTVVAPPANAQPPSNPYFVPHKLALEMEPSM